MTTGAIPTDSRKETWMFAQSGFLQADATSVYLGLMLFLVMILTALGIVAHAAFA